MSIPWHPLQELSWEGDDVDPSGFVGFHMVFSDSLYAFGGSGADDTLAYAHVHVTRQSGPLRHHGLGKERKESTLSTRAAAT